MLSLINNLKEESSDAEVHADIQRVSDIWAATRQDPLLLVWSQHQLLESCVLLHLHLSLLTASGYA